MKTTFSRRQPVFSPAIEFSVVLESGIHDIRFRNPDTVIHKIVKKANSDKKQRKVIRVPVNGIFEFHTETQSWDVAMGFLA